MSKIAIANVTKNAIAKIAMKTVNVTIIAHVKPKRRQKNSYFSRKKLNVIVKNKIN